MNNVEIKVYGDINKISRWKLYIVIGSLLKGNFIL